MRHCAATQAWSGGYRHGRPRSVRPVPIGPATTRPRAAWLLLLVLWAGYFLAAWLDVAVPVERVLKGLLMPALLLCVLATLRDRSPRWLAVGLVFATVGDIAIDVSFEAGLLGFLVMQVCYIVGFVGLGATRTRSVRLAAAGYGLVWIVVNLVLGPTFGELRIPVLIYSAALCTMAALGAGVNARVGIGAALFLISDTLIACGQADLDFAGRSALVMPTYLAGQYLIATGWMRRIRRDVWVPV